MKNNLKGKRERKFLLQCNILQNLKKIIFIVINLVQHNIHKVYFQILFETHLKVKLSLDHMFFQDHRINTILHYHVNQIE